MKNKYDRNLEIIYDYLQTLSKTEIIERYIRGLSLKKAERFANIIEKKLEKNK